MNEEERKMLEDVLELSEQTNRIVRGMRREVLLSRIFHALYWVIIFGVAIVSYYFLKPYIIQVTSALQTVQSVDLKELNTPQ